jgi:iron complex outermembrane receptor protein
MTLLLLLSLGAARADDVLENVEDIAELDISDLLGVVESASNMLEARASAPAAVFVMHREEILQSGTRSIPELLQSIPGVDVVYVAPGISLVAMRGLGGLQANNLVVLVDGVRINSPVDGTVDWEHIAVSVEDLSRIEVVRGPVSAIYGSDAYTGVVSLVTLRQKADGVVTAATLDFGIDGSLETNERAYGSVGFKKDGTTLVASARVLRDATWAAQVEEGEEETPLREATGRLGATVITGQFESTARLDLATSERAWIDHLVLDPTPTQSDEATLYLGSRYRAYGWLRTIELETQHRVLNIDAPSGTEPSGFTYAETDARIGNYKLAAGLRPARWLQLGFAAETGWEDVAADYLHPSESGVLRGRYGGSGSARIELGDWALSLSGRGDVSSRLPKLTWSERASLTYVRKAYTLRASVASAFREPSYVELGARLVDPDSNLILLEGQPDFLPPRLYSAELGLIAIPGRGFTIEPVVFLQRANDLAVLDFDPLVKKTFRNDNDHVDIAGFELDVRWRTSASATLFFRAHHLEWLGERTDTTATVGVEEENPATSAWIGGDATWKDFEGHLEVGYVAPRTYAAQAGIPPRVIFWDIPALTPIDAAVHWRMLDKAPLWLSLRGVWHPQQTNEFPVPAAGVPDVKVLAGVELRRAKD